MVSSNDIQYSAWTRGVSEKGLWKYWLSTLSPERLEQQRQYDRERNKRYKEAHKEQVKQKATERYERMKGHLQEKHDCETCGGHYTTQHEKQHNKTKKCIRASKVYKGLDPDMPAGGP